MARAAARAAAAKAAARAAAAWAATRAAAVKDGESSGGEGGGGTVGGAGDAGVGGGEAKAEQRQPCAHSAQTKAQWVRDGRCTDSSGRLRAATTSAMVESGAGWATTGAEMPEMTTVKC